MFVRVKSTPKSPRKSVQIVSSARVNGKVKQTIVKHIGVAANDEELEELKQLAAKFKAQLEAQETLPLYTPQELEKLELKQQSKKVNNENFYPNLPAI